MKTRRIGLMVRAVAVIAGSGMAISAPLSNADREALLDALDTLKDEANEKVDARFRMAISAYRSAMASDGAAMEFYLKCVEKVEFTDQHKSSSDFREWKRREADRLDDKGLGIALRYQLRWLVMTLQAASENSDRLKLAGEAQTAIDAVAENAEKLKNQRQVLGQDVTQSVFARAYEIGNVEAEKWPRSPMALGSIYEDVIFPVRRMAPDPGVLRSAWMKRISQDLAFREAWVKDAEPRGEKARIGMKSEMESPEIAQFRALELPALQWKMEVDLFKHGDQRDAAGRMLAHIEKNVAHPQVRAWGDEFRDLLVESGKSTAAPASAEPGTPST